MLRFFRIKDFCVNSYEWLTHSSEVWPLGRQIASHLGASCIRLWHLIPSMAHVNLIDPLGPTLVVLRLLLQHSVQIPVASCNSTAVTEATGHGGSFRMLLWLMLGGYDLLLGGWALSNLLYWSPATATGRQLPRGLTCPSVVVVICSLR